MHVVVSWVGSLRCPHALYTSTPLPLSFAVIRGSRLAGEGDRREDEGEKSNDLDRVSLHKKSKGAGGGKTDKQISLQTGVIQH